MRSFPVFWDAAMYGGMAGQRPTPRGRSLLRHYRLGGVDVGKPSVAVALRSVDDGEELLLELLRDGAAAAFANGNAVQGADGGDLAAVPEKKTSSAM